MEKYNLELNHKIDATLGISWEIDIPANSDINDISKSCEIKFKNLVIGPLNPDHDSSLSEMPYFYVEIQGLGLRSQSYMNNVIAGNPKPLVNSGWVKVVNSIGASGTRIGSTPDYAIQVGNDNIDDIRLSSNPFGRSIKINIRNNDFTQAVTRAGQFASLGLEVRFIPNDYVIKQGGSLNYQASSR